MSKAASAPTIALESPQQPDVIALFQASDAYHQALYPDESNYLLDPADLATDNTRFIVARLGGVAVGCGAVVIHSDGSAELKRMWVDAKARGTGLGRRLLSELEAIAQRQGCTVIQLETGISQPEAQSLYKSAGFSPCAPFGDYQADPLSIFMQKPLSSPSGS